MVSVKLLAGVTDFTALIKRLYLLFDNKRHGEAWGGQPFPSFENSQHLAGCYRDVSSNALPLASVKFQPQTASKMPNTHPLLSPWRCGSSLFIYFFYFTRRSVTSSDLVLVYQTGGCHFVGDVRGHVRETSSSRRAGIQTRLHFCE